ncbi:putative protein tag-52 isoform X2 [Cephus cinctus]|nr:putative protein tag-52 isoform X2 [Cephus cinctus]
MQFFMHTMIEKGLLTHASYITLFGNIESLYNVNGELLKELKQDPENVAKAFYRLAPFFKLYSVYAYDYKQALILLQDTEQNDPVTADFIAKQESRPEVGKKLSSLLIAPIQRIPRYKLLLSEVLKHTSTRHKDYNILRGSLAEIEKTAIHINSLVADYEDTQKLLELQRRIISPINLIKPGRKLLRQGPLMRVSRRGNSSYRRHFVLLSDTLLYCKGGVETSLTVCCLLPLNKCKVQRVLSGGLFKVSCLQEILLLYSENGDSEAWIQSLQDAAKKYAECRQTLRKDSSSRMPLRHHNIYQFPSENIPEKRCKRKRHEDGVDEMTDPNISNIIYINRDCEDDGDAEKGTECFPFKKLKKSRTNTTDNLNNKGNTWMDKSLSEGCSNENNCQNKQPYMDSLYPLRQVPLKANRYDKKCRIVAGPSKKSTTLDTINETSYPYEFHQETYEQNIESSTTSFKRIGHFFSAVGNSLRGFFRLR